ncbi:von Willebrand factor type A [Methanohalobium evestigatum Z-7303]|uniref:von Willebrand factor type A n=1 Tax=Methanohalobium evestigatum (strain ATCC BAA-1072 / DSM 3721 / NBRC 107634 / OCM 161 / Z-7303) TaxID=644295 RepID=D7E6X1_METEZ|nr:vWA domain-containing protein [Methanohalobium evestigatum]ADI73595.1 von Willebrand factor type A [Methanohalobium evestigatum Z-7303]
MVSLPFIPLSFEHPEIILLIVPLIIAALYLIHKGTNTRIIESRVIIISLLILALASPYIMVSETRTNENPNLVVISDETSSMELFEGGTGERIYESMASKTPTSMVRLTDEKTNLGDAIVQNSGGDNQIVIVTDGNNNNGESLKSALEFADNTETNVYAVQPELETNDLSVQMKGDKTVVLNNENQFKVIVSQAKDETINYDLEVYANGSLIRSGTFTQSEREKTIDVKNTFESLGANNLRAVITPHREDIDSINNRFYKSVYVIPKPNIQLTANNIDSPLSRILYNLYDVTTSNNFTNIDNKKAVILDNQHINTLSQNEVEKLNNYVTDGNGLVVVGGDQSYSFGGYLNSTFEELLPVISKPTKWTGGRNIVLVLDVSQSTAAHGTQSDILGNAVNLIQNENLKDANLGVIAFGTEGEDVSNGLVYLGIPSNRERLENKIRNLKTETDTSLNLGLSVSQEWLQGETGKLEVIVISDGAIGSSYQKSLDIADDMKKKGVNFYFVNIEPSDPSIEGRYDNRGNLYAKRFIQEIEGSTDTYFQIQRGQRANLVFEDSDIPDDEDISDSGPFPVIEYNSNHFITRDINITGNVSGYNDVTPKAGAQRLVITTNGKPIVTSWRFGLGRVVSYTTDNGYGSGNRWASQMYSGNNSKLTSKLVNWAIGNPRAEEGIVLNAPDGWSGTPIELSLTRYDEGGLPSLQLDDRDDNIELSITGENTYKGSITVDKIGMHDISGYPIAVNYALEYRDVGFNENLPTLIKSHGGKMYTEQEARALLLDDAKESATKTVQTPFDLKMYFILTALGLFLLEIVLRRVREIREYKNTENE